VNDATVFVDDDGVPDNTPVEVFNVTPAGNEPADTLNVNVPSPPDATTVDEYTLPVTPGNNDVVVIATGFTTTIDNTFVAVRESASVTRNVTELVPAVVGVPDNVAPVKVTPAGNVPALTSHVNGPTPPAAVSVCEYAVPVTPSANEFVDTDNAVAAIEIVSVLLAVRPPTSVTPIVNDDTVFTTAVGVPDNTPVDAFNVTPVGRVPAATANVNDPSPPVAATVAE
jgi:hypothetical protein